MTERQSGPAGPPNQSTGALLTRREYLTMRACLLGAHLLLAQEAVASTAIEHPELDMDEQRPWSAWWGDTTASNPEETST